ncbi:MAG: ComEC/Rec2 family competence protein, partial [Candidatus Omnitrophica bacterium]|nr:ComEC/Rec2 family competence protein [Candidatus Omnitrophota bacterium]
MKHPLLVLTLIFVLGIAVADQLRVPFQLLYILLVIVFIFEILLLPSKNISMIFSLIFVFLLGAAGLRNSYILPKSHLLRLIPYKSEKLYLIRGMVVSSPQFKNNLTTFIFKAEELAEDNLSHRCSGNIIVYLKGKGKFSYGDELFLRGNLHRPFYSRTLSRTSYRDYLANQNIYFIMRVKTDFEAVKLNINQGVWLKRFSLQLKNKIEKVLYRQVSIIT